MYGGGRCVVLVLRWVVLPVVSFCLCLPSVCLSLPWLSVCCVLFWSFVCLFGFGSCLVCLVFLSVVCLLDVVWFLSYCWCLLGGRALVVLVRALVF